MVDLDQLEALDTLLWMRGSPVAAKATFATQSTIIRRSRQALHTFGVTLKRGHNTWQTSENSILLNLERRVHQEARFHGYRRLRLHMPWWTTSLLDPDLNVQVAKRWIVHPHSVRIREDDPVSLLKDRVIDACVVTPTQMPAVDPELCAMDLYHSDIHLMELTDDRSPMLFEYHEVGGCRLRLLDFLPHSCRIASRAWFDGHVGLEQLDVNELAAFRKSVDFAYLTPSMAQASGITARPNCSSPRPYVERLVVREECQNHPDVQQLMSMLSDCFGRRGSSDQTGDITILSPMQHLHGALPGMEAFLS